MKSLVVVFATGTIQGNNPLNSLRHPLRWDAGLSRLSSQPFPLLLHELKEQTSQPAQLRVHTGHLGSPDVVARQSRDEDVVEGPMPPKILLI